MKKTVTVKICKNYIRLRVSDNVNNTKKENMFEIYDYDTVLADMKEWESKHSKLLFDNDIY